MCCKHLGERARSSPLHHRWSSRWSRLLPGITVACGVLFEMIRRIQSLASGPGDAPRRRMEIRRSLFLEGSHTLLRTRMEKEPTTLASKEDLAPAGYSWPKIGCLRKSNAERRCERLGVFACRTDKRFVTLPRSIVFRSRPTKATMPFGKCRKQPAFRTKRSPYRAHSRQSALCLTNPESISTSKPCTGRR